MCAYNYIFVDETGWWYEMYRALILSVTNLVTGISYDRSFLGYIIVYNPREILLFK